MIYEETVEVPATFRDKIIKVTCDMCGNEIKCGGHEVDSVEISHRVGSSYPEGSYGEETIVDMCSECFDNVLLPWLTSLDCGHRIEKY